MIYLMSNHSSARKLRANGHPIGHLYGYGGWRNPAKYGERFPYALDNGMFHKPDAEPHGPSRLCEFFGRVGKALDVSYPPLFAIVPDAPYKWDETRRRYTFWIKQCRSLANWRWGIAVQDGATHCDIERLGIGTFPDRDAVCVGGSSEWKDRTIAYWSQWCKSRGVWCHVLRVNNPKRMNVCIDCGVDSADGTGIFRGCRSPEKESPVDTSATDVVLEVANGEVKYE